MQPERILPQPTPQEIQVTHLVPEQVIPAMQQALIDLLQTLSTPITITEQKPYGLAIGATPNFLDALGFSLEAAINHSHAEPML